MRLLRALAALIALTLAPAALAQETVEDLAGRLAAGDFAERAEVVRALGATGDDRAVAVLEALGAGDLAVTREGRVIRTATRNRVTLGFDLFTGEALGELGRRDAERIRVNNALRRDVSTAVARLTLMSPDPERRRVAARNALTGPDPDKREALEIALAAETTPAIRALLEDARAAALLVDAQAPQAERLAAVERLAARGDRIALARLGAALTDADAVVAEAAAEAREKVERIRAVWANAQNVWYGISLGSVLLLAAIGLAISFGVMGVINMAHGELVMIGAYVTFSVQQVFRAHAPELFDWSLLVAAPLAFLVAGAVGVGIERGVCRWLYGRPLETLLATWGVSLILQQAVRSIYGPTNREVGNPSWMSGGFELGQLDVTWSRLWILVFALAVFALLLVILKRTPMGLQMRAVTQNRRMAASMGVRTGWVDALTFGLGAGIGGLAGVALSQIDNVSPNLGQSYIVDSFMVVVFGGVGNLWGAFAGAFTLGIVNKFLEPYAGAVLAKVLVLIFIILFIQRRPRGLFALRGRAVDQ